MDLILAAIQKLYRIERRAKEQNLSLTARLELRQLEARPIFLELGQLIVTLHKDLLPKSPLGKALAYARNQWPAMERYLEVAQAELDNNSIEHSLRSVVLGRRNWLHVGQEAGGEKAANLFSLMITCKRLGVEPYAYLHDILRRLPSHPNKDIWQLTPRGWKETFAHQEPPAQSQRLIPAETSTRPARSTRGIPRRAPGATWFRRTVTLQFIGLLHLFFESKELCCSRQAGGIRRGLVLRDGSP